MSNDYIKVVPDAAPTFDDLLRVVDPVKQINITEHAAALVGMSGRGAGGQRCQLILQRCLAIHLTKPGNAPDDFWMYDSGYLLFQVSTEFRHRKRCTEKKSRLRNAFIR
ncbi:unnamed protein product [Chilo suppressalis]|uniref:Uncharacterized protein n=1 Tax=Chilo suppressalis TaxID=168631 RepID=A0ABN8L8Y2_CHISP|nr:unnamed protein product [Chilo suppressalis]